MKDDTDFLQALLDGARSIRVPYRGEPYVTGPLRLVSNTHLTLDAGVEIIAAQEGFGDRYACLLEARYVKDVTINGANAMLRMRRAEYVKGDSGGGDQHRHGLAIRSSMDVRVFGLTICDTGGDGIYVGQFAPDDVRCQDIDIDGCVCQNVYRNGISVTSAMRAVVRNSGFVGAEGSPPQCGIVVEPSFATSRIQDVMFENCGTLDNAGGGVQVHFKQFGGASEPVGVRFRNCLVQERRGYPVLAFSGEHARGAVRFERCALKALSGGKAEPIYRDEWCKGPIVLEVVDTFLRWPARAVEPEPDAEKAEVVR